MRHHTAYVADVETRSTSYKVINETNQPNHIMTVKKKIVMQTLNNIYDSMINVCYGAATYTFGFMFLFIFFMLSHFKPFHYG